MEEGQPPGLRPASQFIQTTFAYRDLEAIDHDFSQEIKNKLTQLQPRLRREALLTLDNENLDCGDEKTTFNSHRCSDYPLNKAFHYLIVEDSRKGAAVYSISRERNWEFVKSNRLEAEGRLEMALLDALSRHSSHSLLKFGTTENALPGFVREIGVAELEQNMRLNQEEKLFKNKKMKQNKIEIRSPFELRMLNTKILAERQPLFEASFESLASLGSSFLKYFHGPELIEAIESQIEQANSTAIFVLFWGTEGSLGEHALHLWKRSAYKWENENKHKENREAIFGVVKCNTEEEELCKAFGVLPIKQKPQFLAFMDGQRVGQQMGLGDEKFFLDWIHLILQGSLIQINNNKKRKDLLKFGPYTLGIFRDEQQTEFKNYRRVAVLLSGRYQLGYKFDESLDVPRLSTYRTSLFDDNFDEIIHLGTFNTQSILQHITRESMPSILNIGNGFTTDLVIKPEPILLLIYDSLQQKEFNELLVSFFNLYNKLGDGLKYLKLIELDKANSLPLEQFLKEINYNKEEFNEALFCVLIRSSIHYITIPNVQWFKNEFTNNIIEFLGHELIKQYGNNKNINDNNWGKYFSKKVLLDNKTKAHPLMQLQLEQINSIFGWQEIKIKSELLEENNNLHNFDGIEPEKAAAISGCPMMAHLNNLRDEL